MYKTANLLFLAIISIFLFNCSTDDNLKKIKKKLIIKNSTPTELIKTLEQIIQRKNEKLLLKIYTPESSKTIRYNNKIGIGSAGTIDDFFYLEISRLNRIKSKKKEKLNILKIGKNSIFIELASKKKLRIKTKKISGKYYIDVINSPGGKILLLKEK